MKMTNGEFLVEVTYALRFTDEFPRTITMFANDEPVIIELRNVSYDDDSYAIVLARAVLKIAHHTFQDDIAIADLLADGTVVSYDTDYVDWLNDEFKGITK